MNVLIAVILFLVNVLWFVAFCLWFHKRGYAQGHREGYQAGNAEGVTAGRTLADNWWLDSERQVEGTRREFKRSGGAWEA